ncbi:hemerythrin domain-containing protein [Kitasatospora sp. NPDC050543]|uniref:hemerythrin domain-containing protein n=1 Tax=Kitasatospora sp. NPDC050543 TaxID=3364054 RepID=UPI0037B4889D
MGRKAEADIVEELSTEHRAVEELLARVEAAWTGRQEPADGGDRPVGADSGAGGGADSGADSGGSGGHAAVLARGALVEQLSDLLLSHCTAEEEHLFPAVQERVPDGGSMVFTSITDHLAIGQYLSDLAGLAPEDPAYRPLVEDLARAVRNHLDIEERRLFPAARKSLPPAELVTLGEAVRRDRRAETAGGAEG